MKFSAIGAALLFVCSCSDSSSTNDSGVEDAALDASPQDAGLATTFDQSAIKQILGAPIRDVDMLVVIDNSGGMYNEQIDLTSNFSRVVNALSDLNEELPNVHLGVVSTDMGAGPYVIPSCAGQGDNGILQNTAAGSAGCAPPNDRYISDVANSMGGRDTNYQGSLEESFACIAQLGVSGCAFEQPLESMRKALDGSNPANAGFLREEAMLAVLVLSDEDDCSAHDTAMFNPDPSLDNMDSSLGVLSSHRCFEFGVVCDPDTPRVAGTKQNCVSRNDSPYMYGMDDYADFLKSLKPSGGLVLFSAIAGAVESDIVVREYKGGFPELNSTCSSDSRGAVAAIRISELADRMGSPPLHSICNSMESSLTTFGSQLSAMMSGTCLVGTPTLSECRIADVENFGRANERIVQDLPPCDMVAEGACFTVSPNCGASTGTEITVDRRGTAVPPNTLAVAACPQ